MYVERKTQQLLLNHDWLTHMFLGLDINAKVLGVTSSFTLSWSDHVNYTYARAHSRSKANRNLYQIKIHSAIYLLPGYALVHRLR